MTGSSAPAEAEPAPPARRTRTAPPRLRPALGPAARVAPRGPAALRGGPGRRPGRARPGPLRGRPDQTGQRGHAAPGAPGPARLGRRLVREHRPGRLQAAGHPVAALLPARAPGSPTGWPGSPAWATAPPWCCWPTRPRWPPPPCSTSWPVASWAHEPGPAHPVDPQPPARLLRARHGLRRVRPPPARRRLLPGPAARHADYQHRGPVRTSPWPPGWSSWPR